YGNGAVNRAVGANDYRRWGCWYQVGLGHFTVLLQEYRGDAMLNGLRAIEIGTALADDRECHFVTVITYPLPEFRHHRLAGSTGGACKYKHDPLSSTKQRFERDDLAIQVGKCEVGGVCLFGQAYPIRGGIRGGIS